MVASTCPKFSQALNEAQKAGSSCAYNPAMYALADRFTHALSQKWLPRAPVPNKDTGAVPCSVVEAYLPKPGAACTCGAGRPPDPVGAGPQSELLASVVRGQLQQQGQCIHAASCQSFCLCEMQQLAGLKGCENDSLPPAALTGFCYIDATAGIGNAVLVAACPASEKRELRFVGQATPRLGATTFLACLSPTANWRKGQWLDFESVGQLFKVRNLPAFADFLSAAALSDAFSPSLREAAQASRDPI